MREKNEQSLYSLIEEFAKQFTYGYESGLTFDIRASLGGMKEIQTIKDFTMSFDQITNHYKINVVHLEEIHLSNIHPIFLHFQSFIASSSGGKMYAHKEISNGIRYILILVWEKRKGYYCEIDFVGPQLL